MRLQGKVAILTGAASGIGAATARLFAQEGARLCLLDVNNVALRKVEADCQRSRPGVLALALDASLLPKMDEAIERTLQSFGGIDILVNTVVVRVHKPLLEVTEEEFDRSLAVSVKSYYFFSQKVVPHMVKRGGGRIIHISSVLGLVAAPNFSPYCISKGAIINMTRSLALELAEKNITVNSVAPGPIDTPGFQAMVGENPGVLEMRLREVPMGRLGTPEEVAEACLFLASSASSYITGHNLVIDGGFLTH